MPGIKNLYNMCLAAFNKFMKLVQLASKYKSAFTICLAVLISV